MQLGGIIQPVGITDNRPTALLAVFYQHSKVTLLPDPDGGEQPLALIEINILNTKGYLGEKDAWVCLLMLYSPALASRCIIVVNQCDRIEFGIPDVPIESCLLLCPHITMIALLFADQAFAASSLTLPEQLFRLWIASGQKKLPVLLKEEIAERNVFRRCKNTVN